MTKQMAIPATYMRGGTSKGVFFSLNDLPKPAQQAGKHRDAFLLRVIGSPDCYAKQIDGMGGATSSTSKTVIVSKSSRADHDVDYLFGQVAIDNAFVDWSGNCGNLSAAVGPFAIHSGLIDRATIPHNGIAEVRIWQGNIEKTIIARVPIVDGEVQELGDFFLDGVAFPAAEIELTFEKPSSDKQAMFPTGNLVDDLQVPAVGTINATMINAGIPTIFIHAADLGLKGTELQSEINSKPELLSLFETIRAYGAVKMGLINSIEQAETQQHTPKIAFVSEAKTYRCSSGAEVQAEQVDLVVRALSMGQLHHAMMGTAAVAVACAASVEGTVVNRVAGGNVVDSVTFGHPSGILTVGATAQRCNGQWSVDRAVMTRSARILMRGWVYVPSDIFSDNK